MRVTVPLAQSFGNSSFSGPVGTEQENNVGATGWRGELRVELSSDTIRRRHFSCCFR
jgi:hypothetical protein